MVDVASGPIVPMYTPSCTASNSRANPAARFATRRFYAAFGGRARRPHEQLASRGTSSGYFERGPEDAASRMDRGQRTKLLVDRGTDITPEAPEEYICRERFATRCRPAFDSVLVPSRSHRHCRRVISRRIGVAGVSRSFASAEARHVAENLRVFGGELIRRGHDFARSGRRTLERNWRQRRLFVRPQLGRGFGFRDYRWIRLGGFLRFCGCA